MANNLKKVSTLSSLSPSSMSGTDVLYIVHSIGGVTGSYKIQISDFFIGTNNINNAYFSANTFTIVPGKIGINKYPTMALDISGSASVSGNTTIGGSATIINTANIGGALIVGGNGTIGGTLGVTGNTAISGSASIGGNASVGGTLGVTGNTAISGSASIGGNATVTENITITKNATANSYIVTNGTANHFLKGDGSLDDSDYMKLWDFSYYTDTNGWVKWPNGLMFQWLSVDIPLNIGVNDSIPWNVVFPKEFTSIVFGVWLSHSNNIDDGSESVSSVYSYDRFGITSAAIQRVVGTYDPSHRPVTIKILVIGV